MIRFLRDRRSILGWIGFGIATTMIIYFAIFVGPEARPVFDTLLFAMTFIVSAGLFVIAANTYTRYIQDRERQEQGGDDE